jgi:hypothetical protein
MLLSDFLKDMKESKYLQTKDADPNMIDPSKPDKLYTYQLELDTPYKGNIGFEEMAKFYKVASDDQKRQMDIIVEKNDWDAYKRLIKQVLGVNLT